MQFRTVIAERQDVGAVRDAARQLAVRCGFSEAATGRLDDAVVNTASCLLSQPGCHGELFIRPMREEVSGLAAPRIEIVALERAVTDGQAGLATLTPMADEFKVVAIPAMNATHGAVALHIARMVIAPSERFISPFTSALNSIGVGIDVGAICVPRANAPTRCQPWHLEFGTAGFTLTMLHGLGHGAESHRLATAAHRAAGACNSATPNTIVSRIRAALGTAVERDVALSVATLDAPANHLCLIGEHAIRTIVAIPGQSPKVEAFGSTGKARGTDLSWPQGSLLVLYSGDLRDDVRLPDTSVLASMHPAILATALYRDFMPPGGEGTVVVCRHAHPPERTVAVKDVARTPITA